MLISHFIPAFDTQGRYITRKEILFFTFSVYSKPLSIGYPATSIVSFPREIETDRFFRIQAPFVMFSNFVSRLGIRWRKKRFTGVDGSLVLLRSGCSFAFLSPPSSPSLSYAGIERGLRMPRATGGGKTPSFALSPPP